MTNSQITDVVIVGCATLALITFMALVGVPAMMSYRRTWERGIALVLSIYVLAAFAGVGVLLGALIVYEWPRLF